jgi:hypothetical protein
MPNYSYPNIATDCPSTPGTRSAAVTLPDLEYLTEPTIETETAEITHRTAVLYQNRPNPFTGQTTIGYYLPEGLSGAWLRIMNTSAVTVKTAHLTATGEGEVAIDANSLTPGVYFYSLFINNEVIDTNRMVVK